MGFADDIRKFSEKTEKAMDTVVVETLIELNRLVVKRTPVDTGNARASWTASIDAPIIVMGGSRSDKTGNRTLSKAAKVAANAPGSVYYLTNSASYIHYLEFGHSEQAPQGMVRLSIKEIKRRVKDYVS